MSAREQLKQVLREKSLFRGAFTLASGKTSDYYLDCRLTTLDPEGALLTGRAILELLREKGIEADAIGGLTLGADPVVVAVAVVSQMEGRPLPAFIVRKEKKSHGREKMIEGPAPKAGGRVVIVDDVCTSGGSTMEAIARAEEAGLKIAAVVNLVDREEGGSVELRKKYAYFALFTARELLGEEGATARSAQ